MAQQAQLPSVIIANFSWDWIAQAFLETIPEFQEMIDAVSTYYRKCDLLLRTPLAGDLSVFPNIVDIPIIARRARRSRTAVREELGISNGTPLVLLSFGGHGFHVPYEVYVNKYPDFTFLTFSSDPSAAPNVITLNPQEAYHPDILNASDLVLTKLGYGIVTECISHGVPIAYPPRRNFPEFEVLERKSIGM